MGLNPNLRNKVLEFFNFKPEDKYCALCYRRTSIERCHEQDRKSIFMSTLRDRKLDGTKINVGTLLKYFILQHKNEPLWLLCTPCHKYWDRTYKANRSSGSNDTTKKNRSSDTKGTKRTIQQRDLDKIRLESSDEDGEDHDAILSVSSPLQSLGVVKRR